MTLTSGECLPFSFLFLFLGALPCTEWLDDTVGRDHDGFILTGAAASTGNLLETDIPGVFAAGDVRSGSTKRCATAVGEGAMAVQFVHAHLSAHPCRHGSDMSNAACTHLDQIALRELPRSVEGCEDCLRTDGKWLHLRILPHPSVRRKWVICSAVGLRLLASLAGGFTLARRWRIPHRLAKTHALPNRVRSLRFRPGA